MFKFRFVLLVCLLAALTTPVAAPVHAQSGALSISIDSVYAGQYPGALAYVTVRDANGVPVAGLTAADFEINEDRLPKAIPIESVETRVNENTGIWVVLAVDVSGSMAGQRLADAKTAVARFLDTMTPSDHVAVYAFSGAVDLDAADPAREIAFTTDKVPLYTFIDSLQAADKTPLYDAAYKAVLMQDAAPAAEPRAILLFTDGRDEGSAKAGVDTAATEAQRRAIPVFTIGLQDADTDYIKELARRTGGEYQSTDDSAALGELFQGVATRLKTQYILSFVSSLPADGQTHRLNVKVTQNGASAQTEAEMGPLPLIPTATPTPTATPAPTEQMIIAPAPIATSAPATVPPPTATPLPATPSATPIPSWQWLILIAVIAIVGGWMTSRRRQSRPALYCKQCGHNLMGAPEGQPCPVCGSTERLSKGR